MIDAVTTVARDAQTAGSRRRVLVVLSVALVAMTIAVFAPVRSFGFVELDDPLYVRENPHVNQGITPSGVAWAFTTLHGGFWIPMVWLSYMADITTLGPGPGGHHVTNVALHLLATLLLFGWLSRTTGAIWRSWTVAALFAIHPLHVESVAWITERKDVLSGLFCMLALYAYVFYLQRRGWRRLGLVAVAFALGLMSKPMILTLPLVLLLVDIWPLQRLDFSAHDRAAQSRSARSRRNAQPSFASFRGEAWWPLVREKLPLVALAAASGALTLFAHLQHGAVSTLDTVPAGTRMGNALVSYVAYLWMTIWPANLTPFYALPDWLPPWITSPAILVLIALTAAIAGHVRQRLYLAIGWSWYLITLIPVIGLIQVGIQGRADRFMYLPSIGLFVMVVWGIAERLPRFRWRPALVTCATLTLVTAYAVTARAHVWHWKNSVSHWTRAATVGLNVDAYTAHLQLGSVLREKRRFAEAVEHFRHASALRPSDSQPHVELALAFVAEGQLQAAIEAYRQALRIQPDRFDVHNDLGALLEGRGAVAEASEHFREAVRLSPDSAVAHLNLAIALVKMDRVREALAEFREVLRLEPANPMARRAVDGLASLDAGGS